MKALQILCYSFNLRTIIVNNIPNILDVNKLIQILTNLGVEISKISEGSYRFRSNNINLDYLSSQDFKDDGQRLRGSIMIVGPLLARFGKGFCAKTWWR